MRPRDRCFVAMAGLLLGCGLWGLVWSLPPPLAEKRALAAWPKAPSSWAGACAWPKAFDLAWGEHYPWRWAWVALNANLRYRALGQGRWDWNVEGGSGVAVGGQRMLYLDTQGGRDAVTGRWRLDPAGRQAWIDFARAKAALARRNHAVLMLALVPDKASVYPELRPWGWDQVGPSAIDQVQAALAREPELLLVDLRPALARAKDLCQAYSRVDTHWSPEGAAFAWQALAAAARRRWPGRDLPEARDPSSWGWYPWPLPHYGDLAGLLGLWPEPGEPGLRFPATPPGFDYSVLEKVRWDGPLGRGAPWLFYQDSYGHLLSYFPRLEGWSSRWAHYGTATEGSPLDQSMMDWARPGVVVVEIAERALVNGPPR